MICLAHVRDFDLDSGCNEVALQGVKGPHEAGATVESLRAMVWRRLLKDFKGEEARGERFNRFLAMGKALK